MAQTAEQVVLSHEAWQEYREIYRADPWEFALDICGFDKLVERFHKPIIYILTHQTALLIKTLKSPLKSAVITKIKAALRNKGLDYLNQSHFAAIDEFILKFNGRLFRGSGKTTGGEAAITWDITIDPNHAWAIVSRDDPSAQAMCSMIGTIIQSEAYRFFFPERVPDQPHKDLTKTEIRLKGRTKQLSQPCVTAGGVDSGWVSKHFDRIYCDDLVGRENKGAAGLKVVHEFQANADGLKIPEWDEPFLDFTIGTRWARKDDAYSLDKDPDCLSIYVAIEERAEPVTYANMMQAGEPTLREWYDEKKIAKKKAEYMKNVNGDLGPVALLANLFLTIASDGAKVFNDAVVDARKFTWVYNEEADKKIGVARLADPHNPRTSKVLKFPIRSLERRAGADPSESMTGDAWAVTCVGRDTLGTKYQLRTMKGHGPDGFLDALLYVIEVYDPEKIGVEADAMQGWVLRAIEADARFQNHVHKFERVSTQQKSKRWRAENFVSAPLEAGTLYFAPDIDNPLPTECKEWDPDNKHAKDACIDSCGSAVYMFDAPAMGLTAKEIDAAAKADNARYAKSLDPDFGLPIEDVMAEDDWNADFGEETWDYDEEIAI